MERVDQSFVISDLYKMGLAPSDPSITEIFPRKDQLLLIGISQRRSISGDYADEETGGTRRAAVDLFHDSVDGAVR
jgi:hypothetical protein